MLGVLAGFFVVWCIILVGWFVGRRNILGENARQVLSGLTFFVASPALLFETLSKARLQEVFAEPLLVTAVAAIATAAIFFAIAKFLLKRALPEALMSSMAASLANSANLGIPIAVYVLGDASYVAPLLIFQLAFFTPLFLMILDSSTSSHRTTPLRPSASVRISSLMVPMLRWRYSTISAPDEVLRYVPRMGTLVSPILIVESMWERIFFICSGTYTSSPTS